ncbi:hypothetical protein WJX84_007338 [Apatococcus fuscideae]|uniref:Acyl-CoA dehydrogenase n=1 Tax=Apatococcus fuscideae TaxID=2026836 RepID=A0AAW1T8F0_9CHLO
MALSTDKAVGPPAAAHRLDENKLCTYLRASVPELSELSHISSKQFSHGQSNPTYLLETNLGKFVMRKKPPGQVLASAHAVDREFRILAALANTPVPVPRVYCLCQDDAVLGTPFYVMEHMQGRIFTDVSMQGASCQERRAAYQSLAATLGKLHSVKPTEVGLGNYSRNHGYCARQVWRWKQQYLAQLDAEPLQEMQQLIQWLESHVPAADSDPAQTRISHGDYRLDNVVLHPTDAGRVLGVLDWELSALGYPLADLAYCCLAYHLDDSTRCIFPALSEPLAAGIPSEQDFVAAYCKERGCDLPGELEWTFCIALSLFRCAAIVAGVGARARMGNASSKDALRAGSPEVSRQVRRDDTSASDDSASSSAASNSGFDPSPRVQDLIRRVTAFMQQHIYPSEHAFEAHAKDPATKWKISPLNEQLKLKAKAAGLWNLWLPADLKAKLKHLAAHAPAEEEGILLGAGLSNLDYAYLSEIMGRSVWASEIFNCSAPDTGNMEVLARYGSVQQQERWLLPLLRGHIRSCFAMTEPEVASSDATNIRSAICRNGAGYTVSGHKWWASGAMDPRCAVSIFMGKTDPEAETYRQQSMILVPMDAPGVSILRPLDVFGYDDAPHGHAEVMYQDVQVPASNLLLGEGRGFEIAQGRLGPGRLHHCMRMVGMGNRSVELMAQRALQRIAFKGPIASQGAFRSQLATCRVELDAARLTVLAAADALDKHGNKKARGQIAAAKFLTPNTVLKVIDTAIQVHGGGGVSNDFVLASLWAGLYYNVPGTWDLKHDSTSKRTSQEDLAMLVSSWGECLASQVVDFTEHLRQAGLDAGEIDEFLDAQPSLTFSLWFAASPSGVGSLQLELELGDQRGSLGDVFARGLGSASNRRPSGEQVFLALRSQKLVVRESKWQQARLILPGLPKGARYARVVISGQQVSLGGYGLPSEDSGTQFTQPELRWGASQVLEGDAAAVLCCSAVALDMDPNAAPGNIITMWNSAN